jgi:hypothetical protein
MEAASDRYILPPTIGTIHSLGVFTGAAVTPSRLVRDQLQAVRDWAAGAAGLPSMYALGDGIIYFDTTVPAATVFEMSFDAQTPDRLEDAVDSPCIAMIFHQQAVLAGAKAYCALEYLHDDEKAARNRAAFERHMIRLQDKDDALRNELAGPGIVPDCSLFIAAHGRA